MNDPIILAQELTKRYGRTIGIDRISFSVTAGEIFGFLGPNGAGKTTTIRLMLDLLRPTNGQLKVFGKTVRRASPEIRRDCGYLPGNFCAYESMSGYEFLRFSAQMRRVSPSHQTHLIDRFELSRHDLGQKIKHLSHGTRQKLGIVQAFFHQPRLLILDEPTIGLDPLMQEAFYTLLRLTQEKGATVFFSSHNLSEVEKVCHRVAIVRDGTLVGLETLECLKEQRYRRLTVVLREPVADFNLPEARLISRHGLTFEFLVQGDVETMLTSLKDLPIADFAFPKPSLEEVFLTYYREGGTDNG